MNKKSASAGTPICETPLRANDPSLEAFGSQGRASFRRAAVADLARVPYRIGSSGQADGERFRLSSDEQRIVALIAAGYSNKDVARHFFLSESTIHRRIVRISGKLGISNKLELLLLAISREFFSDSQPRR